MENDNRDGLIDNLILLTFVPSFSLTKSFLFDRRNIKVVTEEVLYFLLGKLGFAEQFNSSCWPVASRASMHEFKVVVIKILEELKKTNALFKCSPLQVRKSLLDEYSGGTSAGNRIELLFFNLSCVAVETVFAGQLDDLTDGNDEKLIFDLHSQVYDLTCSHSNVHSQWSAVLQRQRVRQEHLLQERESLIDSIDELCSGIDFDNLEILIQQKTNQIEILLEQLYQLNNEICNFISTRQSFDHLQNTIKGEFICNCKPLIKAVRHKYGKEFFTLSLQHENFALNISKLLQHVYEQIKNETIPKLCVTQPETFLLECNELTENVAGLSNKISTLSTLKTVLETELSELEDSWNKVRLQMIEHLPPSSNQQYSQVQIISSNPCVPFPFHPEVDSVRFGMPSEHPAPYLESNDKIQECSVDEIDSKYFLIPRNSPQSIKSVSPRSQRESPSLLKCAVRNKIVLKERLESIKRKYQAADENRSPSKRNFLHSPATSPHSKRKGSSLISDPSAPILASPLQANKGLMDEQAPEFLSP